MTIREADNRNMTEIVVAYEAWIAILRQRIDRLEAELAEERARRIMGARIELPDTLGE